MSHRIVLLDVMPADRAARIRALVPDSFAFDHGQIPGEEAMKSLIAEADFAITGQVGVSSDVLRAAKKLKLLHKWGVGLDNIDLAAAADCGIGVARTTGSNSLAVAEFTLGLIFGAQRAIAYGHEKLKAGIWHGPAQLPGPTYLLSGKTVGIVGLGAIGQNLARLLRGFGCTVLYAKRTPLSAEDEAALGVRHVDLPTLLASSDVVTLNCPLTPETAGLINAAALSRMKPSAILVNTARGGVVVEADLIAALRARAIAGAAMDVFETEPLPSNSPLLGLDNLVVTPHLASTNADTWEPTVRRMMANFAAVAQGQPLPAGDVVIAPGLSRSAST